MKEKEKKSDNRLWTIFFLGFSSGLPFLLILQTLSLWLTECGVSKTVIGLFAWVTVPYAGKFLVAPFLERYRLPFLSQRLGQRRGWLLITQLALACALFGMGGVDPSTQLLQTALLALMVGICSACQDIIFEAYRIEVLDSDQLGSGACASVLGYRAGMFCAGAGAFYLAHYWGWNKTYITMACCVSIGLITTLLCDEPPSRVREVASGDWWARIIQQPLRAILNYRNELWIIFTFIIVFKMVDTVLNVMSMPFLAELGFTKLEIAHVAKTFGTTAMIIGCVIGGVMLSRQSLYGYLIVCATFQAVASALFVVQAMVGHDLGLLLVTMGIENLSCGMSQVALIAYLSRLCSDQYVATHYALLTSFASLVRVSFSGPAGWVADHLIWPEFYAAVCLFCVPSLLILFFGAFHFKKLSCLEEPRQRHAVVARA